MKTTEELKARARGIAESHFYCDDECEIPWEPFEYHDPDEIETGGRPKSYDPEEILALLPGEGLPAGEWQKLAKSECGVSEATFHRERRAFLKAGRILKSKVSGKWQPLQM